MIVSAVQDFLWILVPIYAATLALYFAMGAGLSALNRRNPERRLQSKRRGEQRTAVEIRQSIISIFVSSLCVSLGLFAQSRGWTMTPLPLTPVTFVLTFVLYLVLFDTWFYFAHRLMHTRALYRWHHLHHQSVAPTPWSNDSMTALDTFITQGFNIIAPFIVPFPPAVMVLHRFYDHFNGTFGHTGFEYFASRLSRWPSVFVCTKYHDQHHGEFLYNFSNYFSFWDRVCGTIHPRYDEEVKRLENLPAHRASGH